MKKCKDCGEIKDVNDFYSSTTSYCKDCQKKRSTLWRKNNPHLRKKQAEYYREWYLKHGRERTKRDNELVALWRELNPEKCRTSQLLRYAVKVGKIKKPKICSECGLERKLNGHHDDYDFPLKVRWLCNSCHKKEHNKIT